MKRFVSLVLLGLGLLQPASAAVPTDFYTRTGTDPTFQELIDSGVIVPGVSSSTTLVPGSTIDANNTLVAQQTGITSAIPTDIRIHTQTNSSVLRGNFSRFPRWYQEDGSIQIMRLFQGDQNVRSGTGLDATPGRIESFFTPFTVQPDTWSVWEGTYTIIHPLTSNIFQLMHEGGQLWAFHLRMSSTGRVYFSRRRTISGLPNDIDIATNMAGKSISFRVLANGYNYQVYKRIPLVDTDWQLVTTGYYTRAVDNRISFRWGMYCGSQPGQSVPNDGLLLMNGVSRTSIPATVPEPPPPPPPPGVTYHWDANGATAGFGNASGTWEETLAAGAPQGWTEDAAGSTALAEVSTGPTDSLFFGTDTSGLGAGTITITDAVGAGDLTFGSASGNITLNGGEIAMSGNRTILAGGTGKTHRINSELSGTGSRTFGGGSTFELYGLNSFTGPLILGNNTSSSLRVRFNTVADVNGGPSALGAPATDADGIIQIGATSLATTLEFTAATSAQSTNRRIRIGSNTGGSGGAFISSNNSDPARTLTFTNAAFNVAATDVSTFNRTLTLQGSNTGDNLIQGAIINNSGTTGGIVSLAKSGTGTWVLAGANSYTGETRINDGVLRIGNGGTTGSLSPSSAIVNNGTLEFRRSNTLTQGTNFSGSGISGSGALVNSGVSSNGVDNFGVTILNVANTYSGLTTITGGGIRVAHAGALGGTTAGTVVVAGAPLGQPRLELAGGVTVTGESLRISGGGRFRGALTSQSGSNVWAGPVTITASGTRIGAENGAGLRINGVIDSEGQPHGIDFRAGPVAGGGAIVLAGANTYLGNTTMSQGRLQLDVGDNRLPVTTRLTLGSAAETVEIDLNGRNQQLAGLALASNVTAPSGIVVTNSSGTPSTLTINTPADTPATYGGVLSGNLALTKTGTSTLTLTGATRSYTGATQIAQGTLALVGGSLASPVSVSSGASLGLTLGSPVTSSSTVNLGGTVQITGTVDNATTYTLLTATGGITGAPALHTAIPGYALEVRDSGTRLVLAYVGLPSPYLTWSQGAPPAADANGDGVPNLLAWVLGATGPAQDATHLLPRLDAHTDPAYFVFTFTRRAEAAADPGTTIAVEYTTTLANWSVAAHDGDHVIILAQPGTPADTVQVRFKRATLAPDGKLFARLRVTATAP
ncbi:MAG: autotransporter-associated beta strand repeat-containing protein [Opitutaceae bacterium]|nr:autotransporter-associated beta strand repeat-containing protein [Opitutaceae bacterium]